MTTTLWFIVVLGVLITAHELGHFLVAKAIGVGVERFSIGFPPRMFGFRRGETEYCVSWIPLGGYVKLRGEHPDEAVDPADRGLYSSRPPSHRAAIIVAGPVMNLLVALVVMPLVFMAGMEVPAYLERPVEVGWVVPDSPADRAGIHPGDRITSIGKKQVANWEGLYEGLALAGDSPSSLTVSSDGQERTLTLPAGAIKPDTGLGALPPLDPVVGSLNPGFPAEKAGVLVGDRIVSAGGLPVGHWSEMAQVISSSAGRSISLVVRRGGETREIVVTPQADEKTGKGLIGISPRAEQVTRRYPLGQAFRKGFGRNVELLKMTFGFVWDLLSMNASIKNLGGPIMIFQVTGEAARAGLSEFLAFLAFLSLQLGVLNLFPIPVLDGGQLLFLGVEGVTRRPLGQRFRENAQRIGFVLLILLILVISYNDILRLLGKG